jgi:aspartyl-tRNA(Asn)/glutamyl-tRNA(Gln) amidotransferase subunit A
MAIKPIPKMDKYTSIPDYHRFLASHADGCGMAVRYYLSRIEAHSHLNAYLEVFATEALQRAAALDEERRSGVAMGKLHGVVVALKDVISYKDHTLTAGSRILSGFKAIYHATVVEKLLEEGAIIIGRNNCDEFAMGSTNENSAYGNVLNARDQTRVPGGSSGGSAVAVQADLCMVSLGSDTGGSVRQPADFCGIIGLKPGYGRISRYGLIAYASSFDQIGIFGRTVPDVARVLGVISGPDEFDSTVARSAADMDGGGAAGAANGSHAAGERTREQSPFEGTGDIRSGSAVFGQDRYTADTRSESPAGGLGSSQPGKDSHNRKYRIAYFKEGLAHPGLDPEMREAILERLGNWQSAGHTVQAIDFKLFDYIVPTYYVLTTAEASSNLARFDGVRYGYRTDSKDLDLTEFYKRNRSEGFGREVKRRILLGTFVLSAGYYDAYFTKAQQVRRLLVEHTNLIFKDFDILVLPTSPTTAFPIGEKMSDPIAMYLADIYTVYANLTGIPGISLPLFTHTNGMPFGVQAMASRFNELSLLQFSHQMMQQ